jgi:NAD(P)-dependent dehydrogenase (short-subunit alcohol dehydrogenase family)
MPSGGQGSEETDPWLFVGHGTGLAAELCAGLGGPGAPAVAAVTPPPLVPDPGASAGGGRGTAAGDTWSWGWAPAVSAWGAALRDGPLAASAVVCTWDATDLPPATPLVDLTPEAWVRQVELPLALWSTAVVAAAERCRDGGSLVVVVELPAALDGEGRADVVAVAEGVVTLARSAALVHGERGVRVNVVASELTTVPATLTGMAPALPGFPGRAAHEVAGAVRMLASPDAAGVTGTVVRADCGRAL